MSPQPKDAIEIRLVKRVTPEIVRDSANLISQLSSKYRPKNPADWLEKVVDSQAVDLIGAWTSETRLVGMTALVSYPLPEEFTRAWIEDVVVDRDFQRRGIARSLVLWAIELAREKGVSQINLTSSSKRVAANELYKSVGFQLLDTNYYRLSL